MDLTRVFRTFLLSDAVLTTASIPAGRAPTDVTGQQPSDPVEMIIRIVVLVIWIVALAGLWQFRKWARVAYLAVAGVGVLSSLLLGSEQRSGLEASLNAVCWLVTGVIIGLAYWSPLASYFGDNGRLPG